MHFSIRKNIVQKTQSRLKGPINILILVVAIPVIAVAAISLSLYFLFLWLKGRLFKDKVAAADDDIYHVEFNLIHNQYVQIVLIEDEFDIELTQLNEIWQEKVYNDETCLYRTKTIPYVPGVDGSILCFYYKEITGGLLLQVLPPNGDNDTMAIHTRLMFLNYQNLQISLVDETGPYFLYNDKDKEDAIQGFNNLEKITIEIALMGQS